MGYSAMTVTEDQSVDVVSPGAPAFVGASQLNNKTWSLDIQLPLRDSDGSELTGLSKLTVVTLQMVGGSNPFVGLSIDEAMVMPGVVVYHLPLTVTDAGNVRTIEVALLNLGGFQAFGAAVTDATS